MHKFPVSPVELATVVASGVKKKVATIPDFFDGAILVQILPLSADARKWFGSESGGFFPFSPTKDGKFIRPAGWRGNGIEVDCLGYAMMKARSCLYAVKHDYGLSSEDIPAGAVVDGRVMSRGAIYVEIGQRVGGPNDVTFKPFAGVVITVSGAHGDEDKECAINGAKCLRDWIDGHCIRRVDVRANICTYAVTVAQFDRLLSEVILQK